VFVAQVIDEDNESPPNEGDEIQEQAVPEESVIEDTDSPSDPIGSQYESDQEEYPLDEYEEYIEFDENDDEDTDIVYIRAGRIDSGEELSDEITDTNSASDSASTLVGSTSTSTELMDIPSDMTPNELLLTLPEDTRIKIYTCRKTQEEPNWTPPRLTIDVERRKKSPKVCNEMLHMGYTWDDEESDSEWIQSLAV
jgi:hypothetical protein